MRDDNDNIPDRLAEPGRDAPHDLPEAEPLANPANRPATPLNAIDEPEIDIVDFQSMQSFPASDSPSWPSPQPGIAEPPEPEQANNERPPARHPTAGGGRA